MCREWQAKFRGKFGGFQGSKIKILLISSLGWGKYS